MRLPPQAPVSSVLSQIYSSFGLRFGGDRKGEGGHAVCVCVGGRGWGGGGVEQLRAYLSMECNYQTGCSRGSSTKTSVTDLLIW